ncbi:MAG: nicotinate-nucleotide adenylyltransferase [Peptococcaceae bacterium]|nr:nicotinate-nucleotide adenylyltransferase [Peptococcaceae bacterium]
MKKEEKKSRIGIMGGTFDPIHYGHLVAAEGARHHFNLEKVVFVPAARPPHKGARVITGPVHRLNMAVLATGSNPNFEVSDIEIKRRGPSYTIDTLYYFHHSRPGSDLYFITGADAVLEILTWHRVQELLDLCSFIAATRPGYRLENLAETLKGLPPGSIEKISVMEVPALAISSTDIRERVRRGMPVKYLLPEEVENYIYEKGLYRE